MWICTEYGWQKAKVEKRWALMRNGKPSTFAESKEEGLAFLSYGSWKEYTVEEVEVVVEISE